MIIDKLPAFRRSLYNVMEDAVREGARDTLTTAKTKAPFSGKGGLRSNTDIKRVKSMLYRVSFWIEYARFQEFGGDSKRRVRNYSTSGTGAHYLKNSGDEQARKLVMIFKKHAVRARP